MHGVERRRDLFGEADGGVNRKLLLALEQRRQRSSLNRGHHIVEKPVGFTGVVEREDVGMIELCGDLDLAQEPFGANGRRQFGT